MAQTWNALQQAQILSNQSPENSIGTMDCNGMPVESDERFAHEIDELIEKENFSSMMDLQDIAESDIKDLESGSLQHTCYESSWQDVMSSDDLEQDKSGDKGENNVNMIPCPLPNSVEVESILEAHSDKEILEPAFETNASLVEYSDISSCSDTEGNFDCNLSSSIDVNMGSNQAGQPSEEGDLNSSMHLSSAEVCHSIVEAGMGEINQQQDTGPPVTTGESNESVNHTGSDCSEGSLLTNAEVSCTEVQGLDNMIGAVPLSKDGQIEEREMTCDLEYFLDHCKELGTSQDGYNCASNHANIDTSLTSNGDENICPTIDSLSVFQLERTTPDAENASKPELQKTFVISGDGKGPLGDHQLNVMNPNPENTSSKPNFQETVKISGNGKDSLDGCQLESNQPGPKSPSSKPDSQETIGVSGHGKDSLDGCQLESNQPGPKSPSSKPDSQETIGVSGHRKDSLDGCQLESNQPGPKSPSSKPDSQETIGVSGHGKKSLDGCQLESNKPNPKSTSSKPVHGNSSQLEGQKFFTSDDEQVERSSFGFLESCFGLRSTVQNTEELKHPEPAHVKKVNESSLFNHTAVESKNKMDEGTDAPKDPPVLSTDQTSKTLLDSERQKCLTGNGTITNKDSLSYLKTQKRKLQPVVLLKTTEKRTCNGKKYHCFECQESTQCVDELIEHCHCMHSLHRSQYCLSCESYFTGGTLAGQHFCGKVKLNDKKKSSPSYTKVLTEEKAKFICRYCSKSFVRQAYYEEHELKHRVVTHHRCDCCGLYFPNAHKCQSHKHKATCTPLILDPFLQTADHSESIHGKSDIPDVVETVGSNVELRNCFVKLMDVCKTSQSPERIHCQVCGKTFRLRAQLNAHLRSHSDEKPFKCDNCEKAFKYTWNLNKHKREQCSQKIVPHEKSSVPDSNFPPKFKCPICFRIFKYSYNRTRHLRHQCLKEYMKKGKGRIGDKYQCPLCKDMFTVAGNRNRHIKQTCIKLKLYRAKGKVKNRKELEELNNTKNEDKDSLLTMSIQKASRYKCTFCPAEYSSKSGYYSHLAKHKLLGHDKKAVKHKHGNAADLKNSSSAVERPTSQESADKDARHPFSCRFCGRAFASPDSLKKHLRLHKGNKPFRCLDCGKNFARHGHLMAHKNVHRRNIQCSVCWEVLPSIGDLLKHRQSHPKKGMLKCPDCPLQFQFPVFLLRHVAVHERRRKLKELVPPKDQATPQKVEEIYKEEFKCGLCQEAFVDSKAFSEHCLTHMPGPSASKCQFCKRHFSSRAGLIRHIRLHTGEKPFPCPTCGRHFHRKEVLKLHQEKCTVEQPLQTSSTKQIRAEHSVDTASKKTSKVYNCSYCPHSFRFPNNLKLHERAHLAKTVFPCSKCGKFYRKRKFKDHVELCNGDKIKPACRKCGRIFTRKNYRNGHEKQCQGKQNKTETETKRGKGTNEKGKFKQQCPQCFKCFRSSRFLQRHISLHSKETAYTCMHCGQKFDSEDRYLQHEVFCDGVHKERRLESLRGSEKIKSMFVEEKNHKEVPVVPGENGESFKCKFCTKSFLRARYLRRHILTHTEVKPYRCKTCESCFSRYDHLKLHQARCRGKRQLEVRVEKMSLNSTSPQSKTQEDGDTLQCKVCSKQLSTPSDLKRHMAMLHITDKPFPCKRCGKTYSTKKTLRTHNLTIRCKKISKESVPSAKNDVQTQPCRETSKLLQRIQVHYMNKFKYQCEYCPRRFKLSGQLKVHVRLHTGEKPYGCANCGEHFIRTDYLKRHLAKCSGKGEKEKILCDKCGDLFTRGALSVHQKTCVISSKSSGSSQQVNEKDKSPTKIKGFSCAKCSDRFLLFSQLQQHFFAKHRSDQQNNDQQQLVSSHMQVIKQEQFDEGYGQNQESSSQINVRERRACSNTDLIKPLKCPQCNMRFSRSTGLGMHMRIHKGVYPLSCTKCHVGFWTRKTMEKHRRKCTGHTLISNNGSAMESAGDLNDTVLVFNKGSNTTGTGVLQTKFSCKDQDQENDAEKGDVSVNKYQCSECDQSFTDGLRLISHLEEHGRQDQERRSDIHRCHVCNKIFAQAGILQRHVKMQHNEKMNNTCEICFKSFRFPSDLDIHRSCHDPSRPFACNLCKMRFLTAKALTIHHRMAHLHAQPPNSKESSVKARTEQSEVYRCEPCDKTYMLKKSYMKHCKIKHKEDFIKTLADNELKKSSGSASQESDEEDARNFEDEDDSDNDSDSAPYFPCHVCGKTFLTSESLEDHQRCHLGEKPFECEECGKCFFQLANLQQHQRCHKSEFQCQMCGKGFVSLFSLRKHKQTHIRKRPHRCTKCHLSFTRSTELAEHMVTHRDENFPCDLCDETFSCKTSRAEHRKMHTEQEEELPPLIPPKPPQTMQVTPAITSNVEQYKYRCGICQVRFPDPEQLSEHGCNPAKERPYSCPECNKHFLHGSHLKKHQLSHQLTGPRSYQCNHCSMSFTHHHLFLTHLRSHGNEKASKDTNFPTSEKRIHVEPVKRDKIYQCPICPESFYQALDLANHLSVHSHMCSVCNMTFPTKKDLDEHEQCHLTAATQYECTECGDSFLGSDAFRKHHCSNRNVTFSEKHRSAQSVSSSKKQSSGTRFQAGDEEEEEVDVGEDFIICPICKRRFSSNSSLMEHHKKHHEDPRPFKCLVCKKGFTKKRYLTQHQQIHSERPYQCEVCSESFKTETALVSHHKMHDAKRQHQCPICSRTYLTANDLAKHKRKHAEHQSLSEDNREYRCDMCYKSFTMFAHLQKHQETHVGQVVYECTECDKAFAFLNLLEEHQRTHSAASTESLQSQSPTRFPYQSSLNE